MDSTISFLVKLPDGIHDPKPTQTQAQVAAGAHVTFSGTITCTDCKDQLVVRVSTPPPDDGGSASPSTMLTSKILKGAGAYTVDIPKGSEPVVMELLQDADKSGGATDGETITVLPPSPDRVPDGAHDGIDIDVDAALAISNDQPKNLPPGSPGGAPTDGTAPGAAPGGAGTAPAGDQ